MRLLSGLKSRAVLVAVTAAYGAALYLACCALAAPKPQTAAAAPPNSPPGERQATLVKPINLSELAEQETSKNPKAALTVLPRRRATTTSAPLPVLGTLNAPLPLHVSRPARQPAPSAEARLPPAVQGAVRWIREDWYRSPAPSRSFAALDSDQHYGPPDTNGAVGPDELVVALNTEFLVQDRATAQLLLGPIDLGRFWGCPSTRQRRVFDPRVAYDHFRHRWLMVAVAGKDEDSQLLLAVSKSDQAKDDWYRFALPVDDSRSHWADYPCLGFDKDRVLATVNLVPIDPAADTKKQSTAIFVIDKDEIYRGLPPTCRPLTGSGSTQVPAISFDNQQPGLFLVQNWSGKEGRLRVCHIDGPKGHEELRELAWPIGPEAWADATVNQIGLRVNFAPQPLDDLSTEAGESIYIPDSRIQNVVYRNGSLWCAQTVFLPAAAPTRSVVQWWQIKPADKPVVQWGRIDDEERGYFYACPSIAVNAKGDALIGFSRLEKYMYASAGYAFRAGDDFNAFRTDHIFKVGEDSYNLLDDNNLNRWGDYSNTVVDPRDDTTFWTIQKYAAARLPSRSYDSRWGTWWAEVKPPSGSKPAPPTVQRVNNVFDAHSGELTAPPPPVLIPTQQTQPQANSTERAERSRADVAFQWTVPAPAAPQTRRVRNERPAPTDVFGFRSLSAARLLTRRVLAENETGPNKATVCEPSVAVHDNNVLVTGNWFAALSNNNGKTFQYIDPLTIFPSAGAGASIIDQRVLYDQRHKLAIWIMEYEGSSLQQRFIRLAVANADDWRTWSYYDLKPSQIGRNKEWLNFPDVTAGRNSLYVTMDLFSDDSSSFTASVVVRLPLERLALHQGLAFEYVVFQDVFSLRGASGTDSTMYFGAHKDAQTMWVMTWPEKVRSLRRIEAAVDPWRSGPYTARGPGFRPWLARCDGRVACAWLSPRGYLGFAWTASQDENYRFPHVRVAIVQVRRDDVVVASQPHLWSSEVALAYPAIAPRGDGTLGISVCYGGSAHHPGHAVGMLLPPSEDGTAQWDLRRTAEGAAEPEGGQWGDYLCICPADVDKSWATVGYSLQNSVGPPKVELVYIKFSTRE